MIVKALHQDRYFRVLSRFNSALLDIGEDLRDFPDLGEAVEAFRGSVVSDSPVGRAISEAGARAIKERLARLRSPSRRGLPLPAPKREGLAR